MTMNDDERDESITEEENGVEVFVIDAQKFYESVQTLEHYVSSLREAYSDLSDQGAPEEALQDLNEQIQVVDTLIHNFRHSVIKSIYGDVDSPEYH